MAPSVENANDALPERGALPNAETGGVDCSGLDGGSGLPMFLGVLLSVALFDSLSILDQPSKLSLGSVSPRT